MLMLGVQMVVGSALTICFRFASKDDTFIDGSTFRLKVSGLFFRFKFRKKLWNHPYIFLFQNLFNRTASHDAVRLKEVSSALKRRQP